jgi:phytoene dehydrogenase-like protein
VTGHRVASLAELPPARAVLFDTSPRAMATIAGRRIPDRYRRRLEGFRVGPGVVKVDWALDGPIPWRAEGARWAGTVHVGGSMADVAAAGSVVGRGGHAEHPFVLVVQASVVDPTRAPEGKHTGWAYCHVPNGSTVDMTERIEAQLERFAPGFRDLILARHTYLPADMEAHDANYLGGDINGGAQHLRQLFTRPVARWDPYRTPDPRLFLCSSSTPPGGGVHGMSGHWAARSALRGVLR